VARVLLGPLGWATKEERTQEADNVTFKIGDILDSLQGVDTP